jgi:hypothetical protein
VSTILKALQRLEDEKSANAKRSLDEQVVAHRPPPAPERRGLKIGAAAFGGLAVAAAAILFWFTREDPDVDVAMESPPPAMAPVAAAAKPAAAEKPRRKSSARSAPAKQNAPKVEVSPIVEVVQHLDEQLADSDEGAAAPERAESTKRANGSKPAAASKLAAASKPAAASEHAAASERAAASKRAAIPSEAGAKRPGRRPLARKPDPQVVPEAVQPKPAPKQVAAAKPPATPVSGVSEAAKPVATPPAPVEIAVAAPKPPPTPVEIAAAAPKPPPTTASASVPAAVREPTQKIVQRAIVPTLSVEKTIWHPDADRRVVIVKMIGTEEDLRLKEGDAIGPLVVKTISPGTVLFDHDGIEVVYNVGS